MKALLGLTAVVVVAFCLLVLVVGGLWVANKVEVPVQDSEMDEGRGEYLLPVPLHMESEQGRDGPTVIAPGVVGGVVYPFPPGFTPTTLPVILDCAGQTGHNFAPCPGDLKRVAEVQSPGDSGSAGGAGDGGGGGSSCK